MTAQDAINKIKAERTTFLGQNVNKHNYPWDVRRELQVMSERNEISPIMYKEALGLTWAVMTDAQKETEWETLNN